MPDVAMILKFLVDCLGVHKNDPPLNYRDFGRLTKGELGAERYRKVLRNTMDAIGAMFLGNENAEELIDRMFAQRMEAPVKVERWRQHGKLLVPAPIRDVPKEASRWLLDEAGNVTNFRDILLHNWAEFLELVEFIRDGFGNEPLEDDLGRLAWLDWFALPLLAMNMHEFSWKMTSFHAGMPMGQLWYLPKVRDIDENGNAVGMLYPSNNVLKWWQDLLGVDLQALHGVLLRNNPEFDAKRELRRWRDEDSVPDKVTIDAWCSIDWKPYYKGTFEDNVALPPLERWKRCKSFLIGKGMDPAQRNWLQDFTDEEKKTFEGRSRGEYLELEITPFTDHSFAEFFGAADPVAAGLPVEELLRKVSVRWAAPSNDILKARLYVAVAFHRAYRSLLKWLGAEEAGLKCSYYWKIYSYIQYVHDTAGSPEKFAKRLEAMPNSVEKDAIIWMFRPELRAILPEMLKTQTGPQARDLRERVRQARLMKKQEHRRA